MKKELLSPVGNFASLKAAIHNGADAVYLGGKKFGARAYADNFSEEEMLRAIKYCHLYNVKIYVTINTMIYERELEECMHYIRFLHQNNVDAVIMQDIGLIAMVRNKFPNLEIHASTQMHNHNQEQLKLLEELGVKRVVLARELSLEEINNLDTSLEIEAFIHGALCISYSGQCLFSSLLLNRSGNRGSCAGICRLPFTLVKNNEEIPTNGKYLLSPKEFSTIDNMKEIMDSNIYSLKIEGRMKSPAYVAFVTRLYRTLIDNYKKKKELIITEQQRKELALLFNRGFTKGHLFKDSNEFLMNSKTSNHQGIPIGEVIHITKDKIKIKLGEDLNQEDGIRFASTDKGMIVNFLYNEKGLLTNSITKNNICFVGNKIGLTEKGLVLKTIDNNLVKQLETIKEKKIPITCLLEAYRNKPLKITLSDKEREYACLGPMVEEATSKETTEEVIREKIDSLGNTPFYLEKIEIRKDNNIFIPMSTLKNIRREVVEKLQKERENTIPHSFVEIEIPKKEKQEKKKRKVCNLNVLVRNEAQLKVCLEEKVNTIYVTNDDLYKKYKTEKNIYLRLPRVLTHFKEYNEENLLIGETGALHKYAKNNNVITDYYLNIANSEAIAFLLELGAKRVTLSIENTIESIEKIVKNTNDLEKIEVMIYGRPEVMVMKHCLLSRFINQEPICKVCTKKDNYYLKDRNNKLYPIKPERSENHMTHLFHYKKRNELDNLKDYQRIGIENYRIEFLDETPEEVESILRKIEKCQI